MLRSSSKTSTIVLIEGDEDARFFQRFLLPNPQNRILVCKGKPNVYSALDIIADRGISGVLTICDSDYDAHLGLERTDVIYVDHNDIEMMMVFSDAFERALRELFPDKFGKTPGSSIVLFRDLILDSASQIGRLRLHSHRKSYGLAFRNVEVAKHVTDGAFTVNSFVTELMSASRESPATFGELLGVSTSTDSGVSLSSITNGHDTCNLIAATSGNTDPNFARTVEMALRLAFDPACFQQSGLCKRIQEWERRTNFEALDPSVL